ncbi:MAG: futalosine hydrolase [Leptolyngbya sp. PLA3]|nr:futalosine hydrolase [Leptolyngbya sp. PL-A3]
MCCHPCPPPVCPRTPRRRKITRGPTSCRIHRHKGGFCSMNRPQSARGTLIAIASTIEAKACGLPDLPFWTERSIGPQLSVVLTGVGKAAAAGGVGTVLDPDRHEVVISLGIGGLLPGSGLEIGQIIAGSASILADEGVQTPEGYQSLADLGFPAFGDGDEIKGDAAWLDRLVRLGMSPRRVATVSTCSGTDALAAEVARRTRASVEAMEGAAVGLVAERRGVRFVEVRVISNTTGDRGRQVWDMRGSLSRLGEVIESLSGPGLGSAGA